MQKIIILGSGIAGLSALYHAKQSHLDAECYSMDNESSLGGLCSSFNIDGFTFDNAIHLSFATEHEVREIFDKTPYNTHLPISFNYDNGNWLLHPIQNNLYELSVEDKISIIESFTKRIINDNPINYEEWLISNYGIEFAKRYPIKYTKKYWSIDAKQMGINWINNRMSQVNLQDVLKGAFVKSNEIHYYAKEMRYPKKGGYKAFIQPLVEYERDSIRLEHEVAKIDTNNRIVMFTNNKEVSYDRLVSSIPLPELVKLIEPRNDEMCALADGLFATSVDLISVGFNKIVTDKLWFYVYDEDILASRIYAPHVKSINNAPFGNSSLQFEIYSSKKSPTKYSVDEMKENVRYTIDKMQLANYDEILFVHHKHLKYGNVVFDLGMEERRDKLLKYVRSLNIEPIGRFGRWDYLWSNQAFMSGIDGVNNVRAMT